ncbi:metallophosphoesterase family protein [Sphingobium boeckii]|uniref:3',5'-cyclic AMP phosphodiesterase CpdA n=1 Tax=Sphingobium boeckii TaxID=1082345 RepID=A0A7W9EEQ8_9SPHN|nr:metallophosphoesterase [Sphingobium boeckii]MBB5686432.1 3',5'-cyclic AMP phosphodiesterase CpdA [Sphingobium boeckii]
MTRLFHVSDLHFGREDEAALAWFAARVKDERPDGVIITGDLTYRARSEEFATATAWLEQLKVPVTIEPGNHDLPYFNPIARFLSPYQRYRKLERAIERPLDLEHVCIVPLKTTARAQWRANWSWGVVRPVSLVRTLTLLQACPANRLKIVTCHHPLIDTADMTKASNTRGGEAALGRLAAAGADVILSGHVHDPFDIRHPIAGRAVRLIGAGTLSERVRTTAPSFNELSFLAGSLQVKVRMMT